MRPPVSEDGDLGALILRMGTISAGFERSDARRHFHSVYTRTARITELEALSAARVAELVAPGQVVLKLARRGFGVLLSGA